MQYRIKRAGILFTVLLGAFQSAFAGGVIELAHYPWITVEYAGKARVYNKNLDRLPPRDPFYVARGDSAEFIKVMDVKIDSSSRDTFTLVFSMGASADPRYMFFRKGEAREALFSLEAQDLNIPGDGVIIASGAVNEMFDRTRKYRLKRRRLREVRQPFYAVGLESTATAEFPLYRNKRLRKVVSRVLPGEKVYVLLTEFDRHYRYYLIRDARGLCGWIKVGKGAWIDETPVKDLYYHGD